MNQAKIDMKSNIGSFREGQESRGIDFCDDSCDSGCTGMMICRSSSLVAANVAEDGVEVALAGMSWLGQSSLGLGE